MPSIEVNRVITSVASADKRIHVAVGVLRNNRQQILLAKRAQHLHQGGLWEFPGGKVEPNETVLDALRRELNEELGVIVENAQSFIRIPYDYPDKSVLLDVWLVENFSGIPSGKQSQPLQWVDVSDLDNYPVPVANKSIINALRLPREMMITGNWINEMDFEKRLLRALDHGIKAVQLRAHQCNEKEFQLLCERARKICDVYGALLIANTGADYFNNVAADGLHLTSIELMKCNHRPVPKNIFLGASCHTLEQIQQAQSIHADYITLGPVYKTASHPEAVPLGLELFSQLLAKTPLLVFGLGGLGILDKEELIQSGAYGIAGISLWW